MNRLQRLSAILIQLQSGGWIRSQDIASRFDISARTVYRDIQSLGVTGVPIISEAGRGYKLIEGYRLPPVQFTYQEASALITAEKLMERHTDKGLVNDHKSALYKIKSILRQSDKEYLYAIEESIQVLANPYLPPPEAAPTSIQPVIEAIASKTKMLLEYQARDKDHSSPREIEPIGLFFLMSKWHLIAYCHLRKDYRDFRLDRVKNLKPIGSTFTKSHPTLKKYLSEITQKEKLVRIELKMKKEDVKYLGDQKYYSGYVSEKVLGDHVVLTFLTSSMMGFAHWYMMIGSYAEIVEPEKLKDEVKAMIRKLETRLN